MWTGIHRNMLGDDKDPEADVMTERGVRQHGGRSGCGAPRDDNDSLTHRIHGRQSHSQLHEGVRAPAEGEFGKHGRWHLTRMPAP